MCFLSKNSFYSNANVKRGFCNKFNAKMYLFQFFSSLFYYSCDSIIIKNANFPVFSLGRGLNTFVFNISVANYFWSQKTTFCRYSELKFKNDGFSLHPSAYAYKKYFRKNEWVHAVQKIWCTPRAKRAFDLVLLQFSPKQAHFMPLTAHNIIIDGAVVPLDNNSSV